MGKPALVQTQNCSFHACLREALLWFCMPEALPHCEANPPACQTTVGFLGRHIIICSYLWLSVVPQRRVSLWRSAATEKARLDPQWTGAAGRVYGGFYPMCSHKWSTQECVCRLKLNWEQVGAIGRPHIKKLQKCPLFKKFVTFKIVFRYIFSSCFF